jgi:transcriptional regulator with XRE-family HTH domain
LVGIAAGWRTDPGKPTMATRTATSLENDGSQSRRRVQDADRHVGMRLRERRMTLGMTLQQLAELIGVTYQQAYKYETGLNRLAAGQLWQVAKGLGVEVDYFFAGLGSQPGAFKPSVRQLLLLKLTRTFLAIPDPRRQAALYDVARALATAERTGGDQNDAAAAAIVVPADPPVGDAGGVRI